MVSSITKLVLIGAGIAIAAGLAFIQYQFQTGQSESSQLARSRLGLDKPPLLGRDRGIAIVDEFLKKGTPPGQTPPSIRDILNNNTRANAGFLYDLDLSREEQKYEPWALRR